MQKSIYEVTAIGMVIEFIYKAHASHTSINVTDASASHTFINVTDASFHIWVKSIEKKNYPNK